MAKNLTAGELDVRRPHRAGVKGITDLAADILRDIADLFRAELQLLHAEVSEKITFAALSLCIIAAGALFLVVTIVLLLQAAIGALVAYGVSWPAASLIIAGLTFIIGGSLTWYGLNRLRLGRMAPSRTINQLHKDVNIANMGSMK
jgi:uncharacterized integral membrane protein